MNNYNSHNSHLEYLLAGCGLILLLVYLSVINFFNNASATGTNETISENLEFWGPILETIIGILFMGALVIAFIKSLRERDPLHVLAVGYVIVVASFLMSILAQFFLSLMIADAMIGTAGIMGQIGINMLWMSLGMSGEAFWLALETAFSAFVAAFLGLGFAFAYVLSIFKK